MTEESRLSVAIAKQSASTLMALAWDRLDSVELAELGRIVALLGEVLKERDVPAMAQVTMFTMMEVTHG